MFQEVALAFVSLLALLFQHEQDRDGLVSGVTRINKAYNNTDGGKKEESVTLPSERHQGPSPLDFYMPLCDNSIQPFYSFQEKNVHS